MNIKIRSNHLIAHDSPDHLIPHGTKNDNTRCREFNNAIYDLYPGRKIHYMDLGCAGGGLVHDFHNDGHIAIGLEGSDYCKTHQQFEWRSKGLGGCPDNLFTCDISRPFDIIDNDTDDRVLFDVITAWEVMEHIAKDRLPVTCHNIHKHLKDDGIFVFSIPVGEAAAHDNVTWHQTIEEMPWWVKLFEEHGFRPANKWVKHVYARGNGGHGSYRTALEKVPVSA